MGMCLNTAHFDDSDAPFHELTCQSMQIHQRIRKLTGTLQEMKNMEQLSARPNNYGGFLGVDDTIDINIVGKKVGSKFGPDINKIHCLSLVHFNAV